MLANGITLAFSENKAGTFSILDGLKEVPELGSSPEKVDNTTLADKNKRSEYGIGDYGDLAFKFKYENANVATSAYRKMRSLEQSGAVGYFKETYPDGTVFAWSAQVSIKLSGGGVNGVIDFTVTMALQSDIEETFAPTTPVSK